MYIMYIITPIKLRKILHLLFDWFIDYIKNKSFIFIFDIPKRLFCS